MSVPLQGRLVARGCLFLSRVRGWRGDQGSLWLPIPLPCDDTRAPTGWRHSPVGPLQLPRTMIPPKEKARVPKDSMTLLPCFYFVEVGVLGVGAVQGALSQALARQVGFCAPFWRGCVVPSLWGCVGPRSLPHSCPSWPPPS